MIAPQPFYESTATLRDALRTATGARHASLDAALMPAGTVWTRDRYVAFLRGTLAAICDTEPAAASTLPAFRLPDGPTRADRVSHDLAALGADGTVEAVVLQLDLRVPAAAFGAAYVIEGSMLGGQHVAQAVERDLGLDADCLTYLRPPGEPVASRWSTFVAELEAFGRRAGSVEWRDAEKTAVATFVAFEAAFRREGLL